MGIWDSLRVGNVRGNYVIIISKFFKNKIGTNKNKTQKLKLKKNFKISTLRFHMFQFYF